MENEVANRGDDVVCASVGCEWRKRVAAQDCVTRSVSRLGPRDHGEHLQRVNKLHCARWVGMAGVKE